LYAARAGTASLAHSHKDYTGFTESRVVSNSAHPRNSDTGNVPEPIRKLACMVL